MEIGLKWNIVGLKAETMVMTRNSNLLGKITILIVICCLGTVAIGSPYASNPNPPDGNTIDAAAFVNLRWYPGDYAVSHDIYFSTNFEDVNNNEPAAFKTNTTDTAELAYGLVRGQTYYWRINEVNEAHLDSPWYGDVWSFFVRPYKAFESNPPDGARHVSLEPLLEWNPGVGALVHYVYFGTDYDDVNTANTDSTEFRVYVGAPDSDWSPVHEGGLTLQPNSYYYWRIDETPDAVNIHKGDVWSFDTFLPLSGSGTKEDPWLIQSLDDFNDFAADANYWDDYTRLETDVNLAGRVYERAVIAPDVNDDEEYFQGTAFTGVFDGNYHKIANLTIDDGGAGNDYLGLFGSINDGEIRNLSIEGGSVSGDRFVGGLAGFNAAGASVSNCYSAGDVSGYYRVGGLVGGIVAGSVSDCCSTGDVSGTFHVGGLVGANDEESNVSNCCSTGDVNSVERVGGLVGFNMSDISKCYSTGNVSGDWEVGGLVGINVGSVSKCYSTGTVSGNWEVGGLVGANGDLDPGSISNCYSVGDLIGIYRVGGLVGWNYYGSASNCFSEGDVNGVERVGGLVGDNNPNSSISNCFWDTDTQTHGVDKGIGFNDGGIVTNVLGLPTSQLHRQSTFTDWDFINTWNIGENQTCPYLRVYLPSDINKDGIVNFLDLSITANQWMQEQLREQGI